MTQSDSQSLLVYPGFSYPEFAYVETAFGGFNRRNNIIRLDQLVIPRDVPDCFIGLYRFQEKLKRWVDEKGTVRGAPRMPCFSDIIPFDIDRPDDLRSALNDVRQIASNVEKIDSKLSSLLTCSFSSNKGFHLYIPTMLFGLEPSIDFPQLQREIAKLLAGGVAIDSVIYEQSRLLRVADTRNRASRRFKRILTLEEFKGCTIDEILQLASKPVGMPRPHFFDVPAVDVHPGLKEIATQAATSIRNRRSRPLTSTRSHFDQKGLERPCIKKLLAGVAQGMRSDAAIRLACEYRIAGAGQEDTQSALLQWNRLNNPPLDKIQLCRTIESAFGGRYSYGCDDSILKELCSTKCPRLKRRSARQKQEKQPR